MKTLLLGLCLLLPTQALAWNVLTEREADGRVFTVAEQVGEGGLFLRLVCYERDFHIEIVSPFAIPAADNTAEVMQVDGNPERLVAGYVEAIDADASVFIGLDSRDEPAAATLLLLAEMMEGEALYLGDPDRTEAVERWHLPGVEAALDRVLAGCS